MKRKNATEGMQGEEYDEEDSGCLYDNDHGGEHGIDRMFQKE